MEERNLLAADLFNTSAYEIPPPPNHHADMATAVGTALAAGAATAEELAAAFSLHSLPNALHTIYLDFDGYLTRNTPWNDGFENPNILTPAYSIDANFAGFSSEELVSIEQIWQRVSEDFLPFHVNVTTQDPGIEALRNTGNGDLAWGQRVVIGGSTNDWYTPIDGEAVGGVAFGSFTWDTDVPTFAFAGDFAGSSADIAEVISHEVGHTLGLAHDGQFRDWRYVPEEGDPEWRREYIEYYAGHGSGSTAWGPIMGVGYGVALTQWSWSEYFNATNNEEGTSPLQDDLAIITGGNGFDYRVDDHGGSIATASALNLDADGKIYSAEGIIERNTDVDYFSFTVKGLGELVTFDINPFHNGPNLDILATVYDSSGVAVASSNPLDDIYASFTDLVLTPGTYYLSIDGIGRPLAFIDPAVHPGPLEGTDFAELPPDTSDWGYSDYGSLGYYSIAGTRKPLVVGVDFDVAAGTSPENWTLFSGGGTQTTLSNLVSEAGVAMPFDLTIRTTASSIAGVASAPIDSANLPSHAFPLDALDGYISTGDEKLTFVWSGLQPGRAYQIFVFGHAGIESSNVVTITGGVWNGVDQEFEFTQMVAPGGLVVNDNHMPGGEDLTTLSYFVISNESGEIAITVDNAEGALAGLGGLAITPTEVGSIEGQKWNDVDGDLIKDPGEEGLAGWSIYLDMNNNGVLDLISTTDQQVVQVAPNVPQALLDNNIVKNELVFAEVGEILDVDVTVNISHTYAADLDMSLVSPSGTRVRLMNDNGHTGDNLVGTVFDDAAARSISSINFNEAPFTGRFRPLQPLSVLNGEDPSGVWTLEIRDDAAGDIGVLNSWSLTITVAGIEIFLEPVTVTDTNGNYTFTDLQAGAYHVREHFQEHQIVDGWRQSWAPPPVTVASEAHVKGIDIGNWIPVQQRGSIQGQKWNDLDGDGEKDAGEPGLPGWTIYIDSDQDGVLDLATDPVTISNTDPPKQIKDFSQVLSQVNYEELGTVLKVEVTLDVDHSFVGDLDAFLVSPSGRNVELFTGVGGQFNDLQNVTLSDDAERSIGTLGADDLPYTGVWRPEGLLSDFLGEDAAGIWTLLIRDTTFADQGKLNSWSLKITAGETFTQTAADGSYRFENLPADEYVVGEAPQGGWEQVPPATTSIPGAVWDKSQWTVTIVGLDDPSDPNGPDSRRNVKNVDFGNQQVVDLPGDFNLNGVVDAADSTIWRDTFGSTVTPYSGADGDGSGTIDQADYLVWKSNFGNSLPASAAAVEEPVALATTFEASASSGSGAAIEQFAVSSAPALAEPVADATALAEPVVHARFAADRPARMAVRTSPIAARADAALLAWLTGLSDSNADRMAGVDAVGGDWDFNDEPVDDDSATALATALDRAFAGLDV